MEESFTLKEMEEVHAEALEYFHTYKNSIESLKQLIEEISKYWKSEETLSYETFNEMFQEKYKKLDEVCQKMANLCKKLDEKRIELQEKSELIINNFE